jgi:hypothetical protein
MWQLNRIKVHQVSEKECKNGENLTLTEKSSYSSSEGRGQAMRFRLANGPLPHIVTSFKQALRHW